MTDRRPPDFFLIGAPKAGTSALHAALAARPDLYLSSVKEPEYYLCGDSFASRAATRASVRSG